MDAAWHADGHAHAGNLGAVMNQQPWPAYLAGLGLGASLIVAIGAQNAFVLRQGLLRRHIGLIVAICAGSDIVLIAAGVAGIGAVITGHTLALTIIRIVGAGFLAWYAVRSARAAWQSTSMSVSGSPVPATAMASISACLAFTWLNPHVYLDTVVLLGTIAATHHPYQWLFAAGAGTASVVWFVSLGYGARALTPIFAKPVSWRILDAGIAVIMAVLSITVIIPVFISR